MVPYVIIKISMQLITCTLQKMLDLGVDILKKPVITKKFKISMSSKFIHPCILAII